MAMLQLDNPERPLPRTLLAARGGFAWWYVDALDDQDTGFVCIWSFGLPFLPGYYGAARRQRGVMARNAPSINLAIYERGTPKWYLLHRLAPESVTWQDGNWTFGDNQFRQTRNADEHLLEAHLNLPVPGAHDRLQGSFSVRGTPVRCTHVPDGPLEHAWTPLLTMGNATASFTLGGAPFFEWSGSAYHDRNGSERRIDQLGIAWWTWCRFFFRDHLIISYLSWAHEGPPEWVLMVVRPDGTTERIPIAVSLGNRVRTPWQQAYPESLYLTAPDGGPLHIAGQSGHLVCIHERPLDSAPFYCRGTMTGRFAGEAMRGMYEVCHPDVIDSDSFRPLVQMAVSHQTRRDSMWLPLFSGPRHDRVSRLISSWFTRDAPAKETT
ncbi:MAG: hypothetical protein ACON4N_10260 [Myxococcota bacterium]